MSQLPPFSVEYFEFLVTHQHYEEATTQLINLCQRLDTNYGLWGEGFTCQDGGIEPSSYVVHCCTRLAAAISTLMADPNFNISLTGFRTLIIYHRWLSVLFAASAFGNADHVLRSFNMEGKGQGNAFEITRQNFQKFCLMYFPDSNIEIQIEPFWEFDRETTASLLLVLQTSRALPTQKAFNKRETILGWLPGRMDEIEKIEWLPTQILHDVYMHCSYAIRADKHKIKETVNRIIRSSLSAKGVHDISALPPKRDKPVMMVILEWFNKRHSIYRTHSTTLRAAREHFHLIGVGYDFATDELTREVFHEFRILKKQQDGFNEICRIAQQELPDIVYYPSIGMHLHTIGMALFRLAPIQLMALGHPATTHSPHIDYVLVEEDYLGDRACFSESVIALPKDCLPYIPPDGIKSIPPLSFDAKQAINGKIKIAVAAAAMKINPTFLEVCKAIADRASTPVEFHFYVALAHGIVHVYLDKSIRMIVPQAVVHEALPYDDYIAEINTCDLFINPFPFGNTNGIVDTIRQGLPGVCFSGPEVHTHIDEGLFRRLSLPEALITSTYEGYIDAVVKLVDDAQWRRKLSDDIRDINPDTVLFNGRPDQFPKVLQELIEGTCKRFHPDSSSPQSGPIGK